MVGGGNTLRCVMQTVCCGAQAAAPTLPSTGPCPTLPAWCSMDPAKQAAPTWTLHQVCVFCVRGMCTRACMCLHASMWLHPWTDRLLTHSVRVRVIVSA